MLVLDANILNRAMLEARVMSLPRKYADRVEFATPALAALDSIAGLVRSA